MTSALIRKVRLNCTHMSLLDLIKVVSVCEVRVHKCVAQVSVSECVSVREREIFKKLSPVNCQPWRPYADSFEGAND